MENLGSSSDGGYLRRALIVLSLTWLTVSCFSIFMRNDAYRNFELATTILLAALVASIMPSALTAWFLKRRPLTMLVSSQIATSLLVALIASR
jgi:hypothetical protein